jgi:hypothetical protein
MGEDPVGHDAAHASHDPAMGPARCTARHSTVRTAGTAVTTNTEVMADTSVTAASPGASSSRSCSVRVNRPEVPVWRWSQQVLSLNGLDHRISSPASHLLPLLVVFGYANWPDNMGWHPRRCTRQCSTVPWRSQPSHCRDTGVATRGPAVPQRPAA